MAFFITLYLDYVIKQYILEDDVEALWSYEGGRTPIL